jgi:biotin carboxyl carrier protein
MATVTNIGAGVYRVEDAGGQVVVYVAGTQGDLWAFADGQVFRESRRSEANADLSRRSEAKAEGHYEIAAPMPATVVKVLVAPGQAVRHGDTLLLVEAMKMELPIRAPGDAIVKAVHCREGDLVQPDRTLVELG